MTRIAFRQVRAYSTNMLALAVGRFRQLAKDIDSASRPFAVWAVAGATPPAATVPLRTLIQAIPAWEAITGQRLLQLGKLDMLIWNGEGIWSMSQFGLLLMDRFRTLWDPGMRCLILLCQHKQKLIAVFWTWPQ
jgi:hypothetical protein